MSRFSIRDPDWLGDVIFKAIVLSSIAFVFVAVASSVRPFPNNPISSIVYIATLGAMVAGFVRICGSGIDYRYTEAKEGRLELYEGLRGLLGRRRVIPASDIRDLERYDVLKKEGVFAKAERPYSGIRLCLRDETSIVLIETNGYGHHADDLQSLREALRLVEGKPG